MTDALLFVKYNFYKYSDVRALSKNIISDVQMNQYKQMKINDDKLR
jgi:hypothetical protein